MKLTQVLSTITLGSLIAMQAQAAPAPQEQKTQKTQNTQNTQQQEDVALKNFNSSVGIQLVSFDAREIDGKKNLVFTHNLVNKGKNSTISSIKWTTLLVNNNQPVLSVPVQIDNFALKPGESTSVTVTLAFDKVKPEVITFVTNPQNQFRPLIVAQELGYTNGKRIIVK